MRLIFVKVQNFRNLDNIEVSLHQRSNYIIGENNIGKSNFLNLLDILCNGRSFDDDDFADPHMPIEVTVQIKLSSEEQGFFDDNFMPDDSSIVRIKYIQRVDEAYPSITFIDSGESVQRKQLQKLHFIKYETTLNPSKLLRVDGTSGAGLIMKSIIDRYVEGEGQTSFLNAEKIGALSEFINSHFGKIHSFKEYSIKAAISENPSELLSRLYYFSDGNREISDTGSGVQYMAMASIYILGQIIEIYNRKAFPFEEQIYIDESGKRVLPVIMAVDEPEVHLHPFLQRSLISYYKSVLDGSDTNFNELLDMCFGIQRITGQLIVVTHSPDILIDDYRNLVRFYRKESVTCCVGGTTVNLTSEYEKHLIMRFQDIKEAFYSRCAIIIEGETEYGCIRGFAKSLNISLDAEEISIINAQGQNSIKPLRTLFEKFDIPCIVIYDSDVKQGLVPRDGEYFTKELFFEIEIVKGLFNQGKHELLSSIVRELDDRGMNETMDADFVRKTFKKIGADITNYIPRKLSEVSSDDEIDFCNMYSAWFNAKKGIMLGKVIGELVPAENIPECYANAIRKAKEVASNAWKQQGKT